MEEQFRDIQELKQKEKEMREESKKRCTELKEKINTIIIKSNANYREVNSVLSRLTYVYRENGIDLLNATDIKKVIEVSRTTY